MTSPEEKALMACAPTAVVLGVGLDAGPTTVMFTPGTVWPAETETTVGALTCPPPVPPPPPPPVLPPGLLLPPPPPQAVHMAIGTRIANNANRDTKFSPGILSV